MIVATFLFSVDVAFSEAVAEDIEFGDANFLYPPATETKKGVAEIATQAETDAGTDDERIVTSKKLKVLLDAINAGIAALTAGQLRAAAWPQAAATSRPTGPSRFPPHR